MYGWQYYNKARVDGYVCGETQKRPRVQKSDQIQMWIFKRKNPFLSQYVKHDRKGNPSSHMQRDLMIVIQLLHRAPTGMKRKGYR